MKVELLGVALSHVFKGGYLHRQNFVLFSQPFSFLSVGMDEVAVALAAI